MMKRENITFVQMCPMLNASTVIRQELSNVDRFFWRRRSLGGEGWTAAA